MTASFQLRGNLPVDVIDYPSEVKPGFTPRYGTTPVILALRQKQGYEFEAIVGKQDLVFFFFLFVRCSSVAQVGLKFAITTRMTLNL